MTEATGHDVLLTRIVNAIANYRGVDTDGVSPPLSSAVDTDALAQLFAPRPNGRDRGTGSVTFDYDGLTVTVQSSGDVHVEASPASQPTSTRRRTRP